MSEDDGAIDRYYEDDRSQDPVVKPIKPVRYPMVGGAWTVAVNGRSRCEVFLPETIVITTMRGQHRTYEHQRAAMPVEISGIFHAARP